MKTSDKVALLLARSQVAQTRALTRAIEGAAYYIQNGQALPNGEIEALEQAEVFIDEAQTLLEEDGE